MVIKIVMGGLWILRANGGVSVIQEISVILQHGRGAGLFNSNSVQIGRCDKILFYLPVIRI